MYRSVIAVVISYSCFSFSAFSSYISSINLGVEKTKGMTDHSQSTFYAGMLSPIIHNQNSLLFADLKTSSNKDVDLSGTHLGLGYRHDLNKSITFGLNGFYDYYKTENPFEQYVGGFELLNDHFEFKSNIYLPQKSDFLYSGFDSELLVKLKVLSLGINHYRFSNEVGNKFNGVGANAKYENSIGVPESPIDFHISVGYQYDDLYEH